MLEISMTVVLHEDNRIPTHSTNREIYRILDRKKAALPSLPTPKATHLCNLDFKVTFLGGRLGSYH